MKNRSLLAVLAACLAAGPIHAQTNDSDDLLKRAKVKCIEQQWDEAIALLHPVSHDCKGYMNCDEAIFWLAYSIEKKGREPELAFKYFAKLNEEYPAGPWTDDACMHLIGIAEKLIMQGRLDYMEYLAELLTSRFDQIRRQAAIALGKFGDNRALPELQLIPTQDEQYVLVAPIIKWIETKGKQDQRVAVQRFIADSLLADARRAETSQVGNAAISFHETDSEKQYKAMLRNDDNWSQRELLSFALWHLLPAREFKEYFSLSGYDQDEWLRKFWHRKDPTPTTVANEYRDELLRRIKYARQHYSELIDYHQSQFQNLQYLHRGRKHAPWDARGELYIKYGPAYVNKLYAYQTEEWTYQKLDMDFFVKQYMTNIYGNAIEPGPLTQQKNMGFDTNLFSYEEPIYQHDYKARLIKDIDLKIVNQLTGQLLHYDISTSEFKPENKDSQYVINFRQRIVIYDGDQRILKTDEQDKVLHFNSKQDMKRQDKISGEFMLELSPGKYEIALSLEDRNSNKLGMWSAEFVVK